MYMIEVLVAATISMAVLAGVLSATSMLYKTATTNRNHVLATDIAQEIMDNARNSSYGKLLTTLGGAETVTQDLPLYAYPSDPSTALFPRPLLRNDDSNSGMTHTTASQNSRFEGTVSETLTNLTPDTTTNGLIEVLVDIRWHDNNGPHEYKVNTQIAQTGVHN
jgi:hypothetical protein